MPLVLLAVLALGGGLLGLFLSMSELSGALDRRGAYLERVRDVQLTLYDRGRLWPPLQKLPRTEVERLALQLGDERYEQRGVAVPMALLGLLGSWLLLAGALGTLRRQPAAGALWSFASLVNIPLAGLSLLVTLVQTRQLLHRLGPAVAEGLGRRSGRPPQAELDELWALGSLYVTGIGLLQGLWVLCLAATTLYLKRMQGREATAP